MPDLLIELHSEEIPARMQARAAEDLKRLVTGGIVDRGLTYSHATAFATPRRLALAVEGLPEATPARREERKGPRTDAPEAALAGFLRSTGLTRDALEIRVDRKSQVYFAVTTSPGRSAAAVVAEVLEDAVRTFPWPKSMRWGGGGLRWVRPLQSMICLLSSETGSEVVPLGIDGLQAGDVTWGHRFMAPGPLRVHSFDDYAAKLRAARVLLDPAERAARIAHDATQLAFARGRELVADEALLAEIAGLVEWPVVLLGEIEPRFLDLPPEVLQTSMREHQKFLSVRNPPTGRIEGYVVVANRETADGGTTILAGNARVLAARLSDAKFFWENDLRTPMEAMAANLDAVTFHGQLGSQGERIRRVAALARELAPRLGADPDLAERAARLAKADLASEMVYEFPELQGVMGRYYAEAAGEDPTVAAAIAEHYSPLGPSDAVPSAPVSVAVALADKLDTLTAFWAIDEKPTGSKDPFALRRAALGTIGVILSNKIRVHLADLFLPTLEELIRQVRWDITETFEAAEEWYEDQFDDPELNDARVQEAGLHLVLQEASFSYVFRFDGLAEQFIKLRRRIGKDKREESEDYNCLVSSISSRTRALDNFKYLEAGRYLADATIVAAQKSVATDLLAFIHDRLKVHLRDQGIRHDVIDACLPLPGNDDLVLLVARVRALQDFLATPHGANLLTGYKRANNILTQEQKKDGVEYSLEPDPRLAETDAERALFAALDAAEAALAPALAAEDFAAAMAALARLRAPIDAFFDTTTVNAESPIIRRNRLCLLNRIREVMNRVAVFSSIEG